MHKKQASSEASIPELEPGPPGKPGKRETAWMIIAVVGMVLTLAMATAVIYYWQWVRALEGYGYIGALLISVLGGATIIIPVPMLAVVFALGAVMEHTWLVGLAAGLGETLGALTIYMTGYGGGTAIQAAATGRLYGMYHRMMAIMRKRGSLTLFLLSAVLNPFFYPAALAAGALHFGIGKYFLVSFAGKTIKGLTVAYAGVWGLKWLLRLLGMPG